MWCCVMCAGEFMRLVELPCLDDLVFVGNPLEEKHSAEGTWMDEATKRLPGLRKLDGERLKAGTISQSADCSPLLLLFQQSQSSSRREKTERLDPCGPRSRPVVRRTAVRLIADFLFCNSSSGVCVHMFDGSFMILSDADHLNKYF